MAFNVPTSGHWISFPLDIAQSVTIEWKENLAHRHAVYYAIKCFFGPLGTMEIPSKVGNTERTKTPTVLKDRTKSVAVRGSADLFVGAEYHEELYQGGALKDYHLRDLCPEGQRWITMKLNHHFHYGQNGDAASLRRFIVYHPIDPPNIFQHRFTGLRPQDYMNNAGAAFASSPFASVVPTDMTQTFRSIGDAVNQSFDSIKAVVGHYLHQYLDEPGVDAAVARLIQQKDRVAKTKDVDKSVKQVEDLLHAVQTDAKAGRNLSKIVGVQPKALGAEDMWILALLVVESSRAKEANAKTDEMMMQRAKQQYEYMKSLTESDEPPPSLYSQLVDGFLDFFRQKPYKELFGTVNNATKRELQDADDVMLLGVEVFTKANQMASAGTELTQELKKFKEGDKKFQEEVTKLEATNIKAPNLVQKAVSGNGKETIVEKQLGEKKK